MKSLDEQITALRLAIAFLTPLNVFHQATIDALEDALITLQRIRREIIG